MAILPELKWKNESWRYWYQALCVRDRGLFTSKFCVEIVAVSSTSPYELNLDDQGIIRLIRLLHGWLFCQKMVAVYPVRPMLFLSTLAQKLRISSKCMKCQSVEQKDVLKFTFSVNGNKLKFTYTWLAVNFVFCCVHMIFVIKKSYFHDSFPLILASGEACREVKGTDGVTMRMVRKMGREWSPLQLIKWSVDL